MRKALGIDIGGTDIKLGIVGETGAVLERDKLPTLPEQGAPDVARRVGDWFAGRTAAGERIDAAGVACAGLVDGGRGVLHFSPNLPGWRDLDLGALFRDALDLPVSVDNDVNCAAWGEYLCGAGRGSGHFICITLGTGIGGGIVIGGRLYRGWQGLAGEVGHQVIAREGPDCTCGNTGCLEAAANAGSIVGRVRALLAEGRGSILAGARELSARGVYEAARAGDAVAQEAFAAAGRELGRGLANLVHVLNPEVIAVGGGVGRAGELILAPARESMRKLLIDDVLAAVRVVGAELENDASFIGAALMALAADGS